MEVEFCYKLVVHWSLLLAVGPGHWPDPDNNLIDSIRLQILKINTVHHRTLRSRKGAIKEKLHYLNFLAHSARVRSGLMTVEVVLICNISHVNKNIHPYEIYKVFSHLLKPIQIFDD